MASNKTGNPAGRPPIISTLRRIEDEQQATTALLERLIAAQQECLQAFTALAEDMRKQPSGPPQRPAQRFVAGVDDHHETQPAIASGLPPDDSDDDRNPPPSHDAGDLDEMRAELAAYQDEDEQTPPPPDEWQLWERRIKMFRRTRIWDPAWGPRPNQRGCAAPAELLEAHGIITGYA